MSRCRLKLFVAGSTERSQRAIGNLQAICRTTLEEPCDFEVIDVLERPERAERARIVVTPTLVREVPPPERRIVGDLSDGPRVAEALGLSPCPEQRPGEPAKT